MKSNATNYNLPPVRNNNALQVGTFSIASVLSPHLVLLVLIIVSAGTVLLGSCSHLLRSVCGTSPLSAECSATVVQLHSDFGSMCIQNGTVMFLFYCDKTVGQLQRGERELRHT